MAGLKAVEGVQLALFGPVKAQLSDSSGALTITDNDPLPALALAKAVALSREPAQLGDVVTFTLVLANSGGGAQAVRLRDVLPQGLVGLGLDQTLALPAQASLTRSLLAQVAANAPFGQPITNTASFSLSTASGQASASFLIAPFHLSHSIFLPTIAKE